jgi:O-antigen ligase
LLLLPAVALVLPRPAAVRIGLAAFAGLIVVALVATVVLGVTSSGAARSPGSLTRVGSALRRNRLLLWHDALTLMAAHPLVGIGPERFQFTSPTARSDSDLRWAHNGFLQQGAEQGVTGLLLLLLLFLWTLLRLGSVPHPDRAVALAGAAVAALGIQACVDYVLHFTALPVVAAALAGAVIASRASHRFQEATAHERWLVGSQGR